MPRERFESNREGELERLSSSINYEGSRGFERGGHIITKARDKGKGGTLIKLLSMKLRIISWNV